MKTRAEMISGRIWISNCKREALIIVMCVAICRQLIASARVVVLTLDKQNHSNYQKRR